VLFSDVYSHSLLSNTDDMMQPTNTGSGEIWALPNQ